MPMPKVLNRKRDGVPEGAVYVGRPSKWGNPHPVGRCFRCGLTHDRAGAIAAFRRTLSVSTVFEARRELRGKDLVCHCAPLPCHADVLLEIANEE